MAVYKSEFRHLRERSRCLRFLQKGEAWLQPGAKQGSVLLDGGEQGVHVARQVAGGLSVHALHVHCEEGEARGLSRAGLAHE